jgi:general secretion pathway protein H
MFSSAPANRQDAGFTLIEIIVVVAIIGIMVAMMGVSMSRDLDRLARLEAERFHLVVNDVRDEAVLSGESYFLEIDEDSASYRFESIRAGGGDAQLLRKRGLKTGVKLEWEVLEQFNADEDEDSNTPPRALISPLGEITPFSARFTGDESAFEVFVDEENRLSRREKNSVF